MKKESDGLGGCADLCGRVLVPTDEELAALNAMREIKGEAVLLKERIKTLEKTGVDDSIPERADIEKKLERLKSEWLEWEGKRKKAAKQRMILLGHEDPDSDAGL